MTDAELLLTILDGADRLSVLSSADQERTLASVKANAKRVAIACGLSEAEGVRLADELVCVLRATADGSRPSRVLH